MGRVLLLVCALLLINACKDTEEYLADLHNSLESQESRLNLAVFDSGQLIHEGMRGLLKQEVLTLDQMGRAVYQAGRIVGGNEVPLLRADAINVLAHVALRYPLPPLEQPYREEKVRDVALDYVERFHRAMEPLQAEALIDGLENPDRVVVEENLARLKKVTGQNFPNDVALWRNWWLTAKPGFLAQAQQNAREPLEKLAFLDYGSRSRSSLGLANSRIVLGFLAATERLHELPLLEDAMEVALTRISRQVVVYGIEYSLLEDKDPVVRAAAARGAGRVLDPRFGAALAVAAAAESSEAARIPMIQALSAYPGGRSIEALILCLMDRSRSVRYQAHQVLKNMTRMDLEDDPDIWEEWWNEEGAKLWL